MAGWKPTRTTPDAATVAAVAELRAAGVSMLQTARQLGLSKGAVAGIIWRHIRRQPPSLGLRNYRPRPPKPVVVPSAPPLPDYGECAWPLSDGRPWRFCEERIRELGRVYCPKHTDEATIRRPIPRVEARP